MASEIIKKSKINEISKLAVINNENEKKYQ
jgi:hypothetical protein